MKKLLAVILLGVFLVSGFAASHASKPEYLVEEQNETITLSEVQLIDTSEYISVSLEESTSLLMEPGEPVIPRITRVYLLPFQSCDIQVSVDFSPLHSYKLNKLVRPAPQPIIDGAKTTVAIVTPSDLIYQSADIYPKNSFSYSTSTGLSAKQHVVFLSVNVYPIHYSPLENTLFINEECTITVTYERPSQPVLFSDEYELLVIAPAEYEEALQPLIDHKNAFGMNTTMVTLESINSQITEGRDDAENVKQRMLNYFIMLHERRKQGSLLLLLFEHRGKGSPGAHASGDSAFRVCAEYTSANALIQLLTSTYRPLKTTSLRLAIIQ